MHSVGQVGMQYCHACADIPPTHESDRFAAFLMLGFSSTDLVPGAASHAPGAPPWPRWWARSALGLIVGVVLLAGHRLQARDQPFKVRVGVEVNAPPLSFKNAQQQLDGFTPELLWKMNGVDGVEIEIVPDYWKGLTEKFAAGQIDVLANVLITAKRRETMDFSVEHSYVHAVAYVRPSCAPIRRTDEFDGKVMGLLSGTAAYEMALDHQGWGARMVVYQGWKDLLWAVKRGDCDFALLMRPLAFEQPDEMGLKPDYVDDLLFKIHMAVHRGDSRTLEHINEALVKVLRSGVADRLYDQWIGPTEPRPVRMVDLRAYAAPIAAVVALVVVLFVWQRHVNRRLSRQARALHESEEKYRLLVEHTSEGIFVVQDGVFRFINAALGRLAGMEPAQLLGQPFLGFMPPEDRVEVERRHRQMLAGEIALNREDYKVVLPSGRELWLLTSTVAIEWQGRPATLSFATDVTGSRQAERDRREAAERLEKIANRVPGMVFQYRLCPDGCACFPYVSDGIERIYRVRGAEVRESNAKVVEAIHPDDRAMVRDSIAESARTLSLWQLEYRVQFPDGVVRWIEGNALPQREDDGSVLWHGYLQDITERKAAADALQRERQRLADIIRGTNVGTWEWNVQTGEVFLNERWAGMLGYTLAELAPTTYETWARLIHPDDLAAANTILEQHFQGHRIDYECEVRLRHKDGRWIWVLDTGKVAAWTAAGRPRVMSGTHLDITARKEAEVKLRESLHEKDALLKEVHHRVKNNLQVITSLLRLEGTKSGDPATQRTLKDMQGRIRSMAVLHETLYRSGNFARINLADYLAQLAAQLFRVQNPAPGMVKLGLDLSPFEVEMDQAIPCGLVVNELLTNSLKHGFPPGHGGEVRLRLQRNEAGNVELEVNDTGVGLPGDFELARANSLGLRLVADLAKQLQGALTIAPGACFTISFPPSRRSGPGAGRGQPITGANPESRSSTTS